MYTSPEEYRKQIEYIANELVKMNNISEAKGDSPLSKFKSTYSNSNQAIEMILTALIDLEKHYKDDKRKMEFIKRTREMFQDFQENFDDIQAFVKKDSK